MGQKFWKVAEKIAGLNIGTLWPTLIAIFLVILWVSYWGFYSQGYNAANEASQADRARYQAYQKHYEECIGRPSIEEARECLGEQPETPREYDRAEDDLNAQWEMAKWAESMFWVTLMATVVGVLGLIAVFRTLTATREMNEIVRSEQRPWLIISPAPKIGKVFHIVTVENQDGTKLTDTHHCFVPRFIISVKNTGKLPATKVKYVVEIVNRWEPCEEEPDQAKFVPRRWSGDDGWYQEAAVQRFFDLHDGDRLRGMQGSRVFEYTIGVDDEQIWETDPFLGHIAIPKANGSYKTEQVVVIAISYSAPGSNKSFQSKFAFNICGDGYLADHPAGERYATGDNLTIRPAESRIE